MKYTILILLLLSACSLPDKGSITQTPISTIPQQTTSTSTHSWKDSANAIIIQYDEFGGNMATEEGTHLPLWTLYGDGLVVWSEDGPPTIGFDREVWIGHLKEEDIQKLISRIEKSGFFSLEPEYKAPAFLIQQGDDASPVLAPNPQGGLDQPTGFIAINLLGREHRVMVYPANWAEAPKAYKIVRTAIQSLRPPDATPFTPCEFTLGATPVSVNVASAPPAWPFGDIELKQHVVITPSQAQSIHTFIKEHGNLIEFQGSIYRIRMMATPPR
jgi:hypothetical protein